MSDSNTGLGNVGANNSGNDNRGSNNSGSFNIGNLNTGHHNVGDCNVGESNTGSYNTGDFNEGSFNAGGFNKGNFRVGMFNTGRAPVMLFNKPTDMTIEEIRELIPETLCSLMAVVLRVRYENMTEEERKENPQVRPCHGGVLRSRSLVVGYRHAWAQMGQADKLRVMSLPNFCPKIFLEITGIDVQKDIPAAEPVEADEIISVGGKRYRLVPVE